MSDPKANPKTVVCEACETPWPCGWDTNGEPWDRHRPVPAVAEADRNITNEERYPG